MGSKEPYLHLLLLEGASWVIKFGKCSLLLGESQCTIACWRLWEVYSQTNKNCLTRMYMPCSGPPRLWSMVLSPGFHQGFPGGSAGKRICLQCGRPGFDPWVGKIPWRRERLPSPVFWPGEFHGQRSLEGYSPWGYKESDMTERFHFSLLHQLCE